MTYRRTGRPSWYSECRIRGDRWRTVCWRTPDRRLALKMEGMWDAIARERAWECVEPVLAKTMRPGELYDLWVESGRKVDELRRRISDIDIAPIVAEFLDVHRRSVAADTLEHIRYHLGILMSADPFPRSLATREYLTRALYAYPGSAGTLRKVHSSWSGFFGYCASIRGLYERNPMELVPRPKKKKTIPSFYDIETVERIVGWQPTEDRRVLYALLYGTGIEISVALGLTRADILPETKEVRAAGTKTHTRDRIARVADWAWDRLWAYVKDALPTARIFPSEWNRYTASDWHAETVGEDGLNLPVRYPMKNARHHWAVRQLRAGTPIKIVQAQLGHSTAQLTLDVYGAWVGDTSDRAQWEAKATAADQARKVAR